MLLIAIGKYGRAWKQIVDTCFPGRTGLDAKNRYFLLTFLSESQLTAQIQTQTTDSEAQERGKSRKERKSIRNPSAGPGSTATATNAKVQHCHEVGPSESKQCVYSTLVSVVMP